MGHNTIDPMSLEKIAHALSLSFVDAQKTALGRKDGLNYGHAAAVWPQYDLPERPVSEPG